LAKSDEFVVVVVIVVVVVGGGGGRTVVSEFSGAFPDFPMHSIVVCTHFVQVWELWVSI
jgi:hypothetical protein